VRLDVGPRVGLVVGVEVGPGEGAGEGDGLVGPEVGTEIGPRFSFSRYNSNCPFIRSTCPGVNLVRQKLSEE
jgi:hypothetical protein